MEDEKKTKKQLVEELKALRQCVAELKGFEEEVKQTRVNQEKFTKAFLQNSIPVGINRLKNGRFVEINNAFLKLMGRKRDEVIGHTPTGIGLITEEQRASLFNELNKKGRIENFEVEVKTKNGTRHSLFNAVLMNINNDKCLLTVMTDITDRKRAEELLRESEARFRELFNHMSSGVAVYEAVDNGGDFIFSDFNPAAEKIEKVSRKDVLGKRVSEVFPGVKAFGVFEVFQRVWQAGNTEYFPQNIYKDERDPGSWRDNWVFKLPTGEIVAVYNDITPLKQKEEELRRSEEHFRSLIEQMPVGIFIYQGTKIRYLNPACERITGYTQDEAYSFDIWDMAHPDFKDSIREYVYRRLRKEPIPELHEFKIITKSGEERWLERSAIAIELQGNPCVLVTVTDVTERKHAEEILKTSEQRYRGLMEHSSDAILLADMQGNIIAANRKAEGFFGYTKEELLHMHYTQLHPMPELGRTIAAFKEIIQGNTGHLSTAFIQRKDGNRIPVDITGSVIEYAGEKIVQGSFRDISEHKSAKDTLEKLVRERTSELTQNNEQLTLEIKQRKSAEAAMKRKSRELKQHTDKLSELNAALKVLLKQREYDRNDMEEKVTSNVKELLLPYIEEMKNRKIDPKSKVFLSIIEANLQNIISPFTQRLSSKYLGLTPREVQVADLIRQGKNTKEIARFMGISASAISLHRYHIREKLGLIDQKTNLQTHLQTLL